MSQKYINSECRRCENCIEIYHQLVFCTKTPKDFIRMPFECKQYSPRDKNQLGKNKNRISNHKIVKSIELLTEVKKNAILSAYMAGDLILDISNEMLISRKLVSQIIGKDLIKKRRNDINLARKRQITIEKRKEKDTIEDLKQRYRECLRRNRK